MKAVIDNHLYAVEVDIISHCLLINGSLTYLTRLVTGLCDVGDGQSGRVRGDNTVFWNHLKWETDAPIKPTRSFHEEVDMLEVIMQCSGTTSSGKQMHLLNQPAQFKRSGHVRGTD